MTEREPSILGTLLCVASIALLLTAFLLPWWSYDTSTGRKTAPGGPQEADDTRVERHQYDIGPFQQGGDTTPSDEAGADLAALLIGLGWAAAMVGLVVTLAGESLAFVTAVPRWLTLVCSTLAVLGLLAALAVTWLMVPGTMEQQGVTGTFTDALLDPGYVLATLDLGWIAAALAVPTVLGVLAFRYQAGSHDPAAIESYA